MDKLGAESREQEVTARGTDGGSNGQRGGATAEARACTCPGPGTSPGAGHLPARVPTPPWRGLAGRHGRPAAPGACLTGLPPQLHHSLLRVQDALAIRDGRATVPFLQYVTCYVRHCAILSEQMRKSLAARIRGIAFEY